jgi:hypothetical protein
LYDLIVDGEEGDSKVSGVSQRGSGSGGITGTSNDSAYNSLVVFDCLLTGTSEVRDVGWGVGLQ